MSSARLYDRTLPRPAAFQLESETPAKERSNGDDNRQDNHAVEVRRKRHGSDDIGSDQNLEPEQDGAAEVVAQAQIGTCIGASAQRDEARRGDDEPAED